MTSTATHCSMFGSLRSCPFCFVNYFKNLRFSSICCIAAPPPPSQCRAPSWTTSTHLGQLWLSHNGPIQSLSHHSPHGPWGEVDTQFMFYTLHVRRSVSTFMLLLLISLPLVSPTSLSPITFTFILYMQLRRMVFFLVLLTAFESTTHIIITQTLSLCLYHTLFSCFSCVDLLFRFYHHDVEEECCCLQQSCHHVMGS